jgi:hypothetical protein
MTADHEGERVAVARRDATRELDVVVLPLHTRPGATVSHGV